MTVEKIIQLADFRFVLFEATHPCFILRYLKAAPSLDHTVTYETPKLNRFDRRSGIFVIEPDDQKLVPQHDILESALQDRLQTIWSRKFWGTARDEALLRRLDFYPPLSDLVGIRGKPKRWLGGTGFQPHYDHIHHKRYKPVDIPWPLSDSFLDANEAGLDLVVFEDQLTTVGTRLKKLGASTKKVLFARPEANFKPPMVLYSQGFTKFAFCNYKVRFQHVFRSITGPDTDADLLRFLSAVLGSRLIQYLAFHSGASNGMGRDQLQLYESLNLPFPLPDHELVPENAKEIIREVADIFKQAERIGNKTDAAERTVLIKEAKEKLEPLVQDYFSVTNPERILIEDTLTLFQSSIHRSNLDSLVPSLAFPEAAERKRYADTLCDVLNRRARRQGIKINAEAIISKVLNLVLFTVVFADERNPYKEINGGSKLWEALDRVDRAAQHDNGSFSYLRGFSYFEPDRLHMLKPATMRNWCRTAAINDADAIFEHLARRNS